MGAKDVARKIETYFATNRNQLGEEAPWYGRNFHESGSECYRVGKAVVDATKDGEYEVSKIETFPEEAGLDGHDQGAKLGSTRLFTEIKKRMRDQGRDLVVLIHGYASAFATANERAAELTEKYLVRGKDGELRQPIVLSFSWPANGETIPFASYISDRQDAAKSGEAIARLFFRMCDFFVEEARQARGQDSGDKHAPCANRLHLVAHSMGNSALLSAVQVIIKRRGADRLPAILDNVFLMAPDEDDDALQDRLKLGMLPALGNAVHVYHSKDDQALVISDTTKLNPDRLGHNGPVEMDRTDEKVIAVDCRHVDVTKLTHGNHQYYRLREEVITDVQAVLAGRHPEEVPRRTRLVHPRRYMIQRPAD